MTAPAVDGTALTSPESLSTERLRLPPLGPAHLDSLWVGLHDPQTRRLTGTRSTFTRRAVADHLESIGARADRADWAIIDRAGGDFLGEVVLNELDVDNAAMNFRIALQPGRAGLGYGTEATTAVLDYAFTRVGLHRVYLDVYSFNPRAERSYLKAGFRVEGRRRHTLCWDGVWIDSILMSVLSTDIR